MHFGWRIFSGSYWAHDCPSSRRNLGHGGARPCLPVGLRSQPIWRNDQGGVTAAGHSAASYQGLGPGLLPTSYPSLQWQATTCRTAPEVPFEPAAGSTPRTATVGDDTDYSAEVTGTISSATGSFDDASPTITETGQVDDQGAQIANSFTLQLNSEFFSNSPACSGSADPSNCEGWQQFIYEMIRPTTSVFMQYWRLTMTPPARLAGIRITPTATPTAQHPRFPAVPLPPLTLP